jgi:hypothetical protein
MKCGGTTQRNSGYQPRGFLRGVPSCDFVPFVVKASELDPHPSPEAAAFRLFPVE